jgi:hypothetical protein
MTKQTSEPPKYNFEKPTAWIGAICAIITVIFLFIDKCSPTNQPLIPTVIINQNDNDYSVEHDNDNTMAGPSRDSAVNDKPESIPITTDLDKQKTDGEHKISDGDTYYSRLWINSKDGPIDEVLLGGKKVPIVSNTQNMIKIIIPELNRSYPISLVKNQDTVQCSDVFFSKNNDRKTLNCNFE